MTIKNSLTGKRIGLRIRKHPSQERHTAMSETPINQFILDQLKQISGQLMAVSGLQAVIAAMDERSKHQTSQMEDMKKSMADMGKGYAEHAQELTAIKAQVEKDGSRIDSLEVFRARIETAEREGAFKSGKAEGLQASIFWAFQKVVLPVLYAAALPAAAWFLAHDKTQVNITQPVFTQPANR